MTRRVVFRPEAEDDALEIHQWYEARGDGLGVEFGRAVDELVARMAANPLAFQQAHGETRRAVLARFPYAIYFRVVGEEIVVLALHGRRISRTGEPARSIGRIRGVSKRARGLTPRWSRRRLGDREHRGSARPLDG